VLVRGHDPADHAAAVVPLLTDPELAAQVGAAGVRAAGRATWDRSVERLLNVYGDVVARAAAEAADAADEDEVAV
jgi:tagatose-1,6-bisphosphate aldolase